MDLGAYAQIDNLEEILKANNIDVPRLRGLRYMRDQRPMTRAEMEDHWEWIAVSRCEDCCQGRFKLNPTLICLSGRTNDIVNKYMIRDKNRHPIGIKWDKVHGKKRKVFKYQFRKARNQVLKEDQTFNKYCGRDDVLYIHARLGGGNWKYYNCDEIIKSQPWYLDHAEDAFDCTYVDIYAKIDPNTVKEKEHKDE